MAERHLPTPLTPAFQERASAELCTLNNRLNDKLKRDIAREVYNRNVLKHKEDAVVAQIRILRGEKEYEVGSPESDVFVTPKASPSDPHFEGSFQSQGNTTYYSLVRLDEKIHHQTLERELAEQDELSKSFRSIIKRENQQKPYNSHYKLTKSKIPSKKDATPRALQSLQFNYKLRSHSPQKPPKLVLKLKTEPDDMSVKTFGQKEEEIMSNPDSCLEPVSSGYATGCSPRDTNGSEALGADTTEIATSEDIPHDDKSRGSSSVSSDPGTWDSTFPTNDDDTCVEKENSENIAKSDSIVFFKEPDNPISNNNPTDGMNKMTRLEFQAESQHDYLCGFTENDSYVNIQMENKYSSPINNCDYSSGSSVANNFFIDASSLRDENEMYLPSIRNPVFPSTNAEPKTFICDENSQKSAIDKSELGVRKLDNILEKEPKNYVDSKANEVEEEKKDEFLENRKFIRRNTFDLDPDDTTLNRLKEEYEKSQIKDTSPTINDLNKRNVESTQAELESNRQSTSINTTTNEDIHSPDSLNNDFHEESFNTSNNKMELDPAKKLCYNHIDKNGESESEQVSSAIENKYLNEGIIMSSTLQGNSNADDDKIPATSDLGTSSEFSNSYESHLAKRKGDSENVSPKISDSFSKDSFFNKLECMPIVSGGAQISDVSSSDYSVSASPMTRRKTEFAPILSGGFDNIPSPEEKKSKAKVVSSLSTSWVVDMSDSKSLPESLNDNKRERTRLNNSGMGFFVPLDDPYPSLDSVTSNSSFERSDSRHDKKNGHYNERNSACGFYIDLKESNIKNISKFDAPQEKKLFSMFIDIGNSKSSDSTSPKSKPGSPFFPNKRKGPSMTDRLSTKHLDKKSASTSSDSGLDLGEHPEIVKGRLLFNENLEQNQNLSDCSNNGSEILTKKQGFYMFIGNEESPVTRRRTLPPGVKQNPNRHSWNSDYKQPFKSETATIRKEHKRSSSVSYDQTFVGGNKFPSGPASIEDSLLKSKERKNKSMLSSWHGPIKPTSELSRIISNGAKHEFREKGKDIPKSLEHSEGEIVEKGEDMSCSIKSDEVFDISNATVSSRDDPNRTFVVDDVSKAVNINTNDLELSTPSHDIASDLSKDESVTDPVQEPKSTSSNVTNRSSVCDVDANTPKLSEFSNSQPALDNTSSGFVKLSDMDKEPPAQMWKSTSKGSRMSRSIPDGSFLENKALTNSASSRSLSRLFPHLYQKTDSRETSLQSSMHSSIIEPSPLEVSTEEEGSCGSAGPCSRLGEDLLRMFLDEISPDVTVEVGGRRIKAHKCILSSRCQYFAGMLSGGWVESAGNVISLQGFSYNTVHFALCHIYSGASQIPETINIVELATLADMLCLEGLKEVIMYTLKVKYCHFFHKPCSGCLVGVVECLPLAAAYSLDEIYRKSLRWITKYFVRVWPTKGFASLPKELHDKCFKQHVVHMSCDTVLETVMGCDKLDSTIPNVRWANTVFALNSKLHEATVKYLTQHFSTVLASTAFMNLGREDSWTVTQLEETLLNISKSLSPDQACQSYKRIKIILSSINKIEPEDIDWKLEFLELLTKLETYIEDCLIRQAGRAARTTSWAKLDPSLRRKIQDAACLVFTPGPRPSSTSREIVKVNKTNETKPKSPAPVPAVIRKNIPSTSQSAKTTQSPLPKPKTPKTLAQVKSRYLEPKPARRDTPESQQRRMSGGGKAISSSDSSRTSSPATARVSRPGTAERRTPIAGRRLTGGSTEISSPNMRDQRPSTSKEPEVKGALLKRQSTFRVATKSSSAKQVLPTARQPSRTRPPSNLPTKTNVAGSNSTTSGNRTKQTSTARSGTFLRDDSSHASKKFQQAN